MKITYKTNVLDIIRLVENNTPALWEKEHNNFPNTWGGVNALTKQVVKDLLVKNQQDLSDILQSAQIL